MEIIGNALAAAAASRRLRAAGIANDRIVYLPMRGEDTPSPAAIAAIVGGPFQSMSCLRACGKSERFASIAADRSVAWCSYTRARRRLDGLTHGPSSAPSTASASIPATAGPLSASGRGSADRRLIGRRPRALLAAIKQPSPHLHGDAWHACDIPRYSSPPNAESE